MLPYSIRLTKQRYVMPQAAYAEPGEARVLDNDRVIDLTPLLKPDGRIRWDIPAGDWTIMRFVARGTGQTTRPAPQSGHGFECNKFDAASYRRHWENYQKKLLDRVVALGGPLQPGRGLTTIHLDSWEMSSQNWTEDFREEFRKRRGYDPRPFYPAWMGMVVGSTEKTERFLWDMRKTSQELVLEEHAEAIRQLAHEHGLLYSNEPYDMNPAGDIDLGSIADIPMCEFWNTPHDTEYSCIEAASIANTMGRKVVKAEAFTTNREAFVRTPANMKNQTDWALGHGDQRIHVSHLSASGPRRCGEAGHDHGPVWRPLAPQPDVLGFSRSLSRISRALFPHSCARARRWPTSSISLRRAPPTSSNRPPTRSPKVPACRARDPACATRKDIPSMP